MIAALMALRNKPGRRSCSPLRRRSGNLISWDRLDLWDRLDIGLTTARVGTGLHLEQLLHIRDSFTNPESCSDRDGCRSILRDGCFSCTLFGSEIAEPGGSTALLQASKPAAQWI